MNARTARRLAIALATVTATYLWSIGAQATGTGKSFTSLAPGFTQDLHAVTGDFVDPEFGILGGVAFGPSAAAGQPGDVWSAECYFYGTRLHRFAKDVTEVQDPNWRFPAVGQGAVGLECCVGDTPSLELVVRLDDAPSRQAVLAGRAMLRALGGGCQVPIGAAAAVMGDRLHLRGVVLSPDGGRRIEGQCDGAAADSERLGEQLAGDLLGRGARELLS